MPAVIVPRRSSAIFSLILAVLPCARAATPGVVEPPEIPWKIHQTVRALYPLAMMRLGVTTGEARVRVSIDASGQLLDALLTACTQPEFGEEALRAVRQWRYDPAHVGDNAIGVVGDVTFLFAVNGPVAIEKQPASQAVEIERDVSKMAYHAVSLKLLDQIPTPTNLAPPVYPKEWSDRGIVGKAVVEFYIDETGRARIPLVTSTDHRLLGASAVAAVAQWRFEPATCKGRPVLVRAEQVFSFFPPEKK